VQALVAIEAGPIVRVQGRPAQGTRHQVLFGQVVGTGEQVVVKLERVSGALERERVALTSLNAQDAPVPRLLAAGTAVFDGDRLACLATERCAGSAPTTLEGWRRMGSALAQIGGLQLLPAALPLLDLVAFGREHARRVSELSERLAPFVRSVPDWEQLALPQVPDPAPLVITHGDPGPGNFLDDGAHGTLIDWEEAHIAPRGLDLARLVFIAMLGAGPDGYVARDQQARARAAVHGYRASSSDAWRGPRAQARWWLTVAGIQFIHRRCALGGRPAPWEQAAEVLQAVLSADSGWLDRVVA